MFKDNQAIKDSDLAETFGDFFEDKITNITNDCKIDNNVYNGTRKMTEENLNFMTEKDVKEAIESIKLQLFINAFHYLILI